MTKLEMALLDLLKEDCRLPLEKLAVMTGTSVEKVAETIDSLEQRHVILRYAPMINWDLTDRERVEAMIEVRVTPQRDMGFDAIARRIYCFDEVKSVFLMFFGRKRAINDFSGEKPGHAGRRGNVGQKRLKKGIPGLR